MPEFTGTLRPPRRATAPSSPALGEVYYDTATNELLWWNGTAWVSGGAGNGGGGGTMGAASYTQTGTTTASVTAAWKTLALTGGTTVIDPPGSVIVNGDNSISVAEAGWYLLSGSVHGAWGTASVMLVSIASAPNAEGVGSQALGSTGGGPRGTATALMKLTPSDKMYLNGWAQTSMTLAINQFSCTRVGGPQGPPGGTMGAASCYCGAGANTALAANTWKALTFNQTPDIDPAGAFTIGPDYLQVNQDGWYTIHASGNFPTGLTSAYMCITTVSGVDASQTSGGFTASGGYPRITCSGVIRLTAGQRLYVNANTTAAGYVGMFSFSIARVGGPKGDPGNAGDPATTSLLGVSRLSVAPASALDPVVLGENDQRISRNFPAQSTLPVSPVEGQEFYYRVPNAPYPLWHLRFTTAWSPGEPAVWEFMGGQPLYGENETGGTITSTTHADPATGAAGAAVVCPLKGIYDFDSTALLTTAATLGAFAMVSLKTSAAAATDADRVGQVTTPAASGSVGTVGGHRRYTIATAGQEVKQQFRVQTGSSAITFRRLKATPVWVKA